MDNNQGYLITEQGDLGLGLEPIREEYDENVKSNKNNNIRYEETKKQDKE